MDPIELLKKYYQVDSLALKILLGHSLAVAGMAMEVAEANGCSPAEVEFIRESAILHDIGILYTDAQSIGCQGELPYLLHGVKGHDLLVAEGLPRHALVCERHTGTGITLREIREKGLPLPDRPLVPVSRAEIIICYCDKFFSKDPGRLKERKHPEEIIREIGTFGPEKTELFRRWHQQFSF
ncbi:MAG: HDIG domain-containing protein [Bacteroidales bacterium]